MEHGDRNKRAGHDPSRVVVRFGFADGGLARGKVGHQPAKAQRLHYPAETNKTFKKHLLISLPNYLSCLENESIVVYMNPFAKMVHP